MTAARQSFDAVAAAQADGLTDEDRKALVDRLARLEGHIRAIRRMLTEQRRADEILLQAAAVKAALNRFSAVLLESEIRSCVAEPAGSGSEERLERVGKVLGTLLKQS